jgi:hypothetical protein
MAAQTHLIACLTCNKSRYIILIMLKSCQLDSAGAPAWGGEGPRDSVFGRKPKPAWGGGLIGRNARTPFRPAFNRICARRARFRPGGPTLVQPTWGDFGRWARVPRALALRRRRPWPKGLRPISAATDEELGNNFDRPAGEAPRKTEGLGVALHG